MKEIKIFIVSLFIFFALMGCNTPTNETPNENNKENSTSIEYPKLKIESNYEGYIYKVSLVGYQFEDLRILQNQSSVFDLSNGMPSGYENINVNICFRPDDLRLSAKSPASICCNFVNGKTTTIKLSTKGDVTVTE